MNKWRHFPSTRLMIIFKILTFYSVNVRHASYCLLTTCLTEQVGQEILSNLHSDREKIQRARERVSCTHTACMDSSVCSNKCLWDRRNVRPAASSKLHNLSTKYVTFWVHECTFRVCSFQEVCETSRPQKVPNWWCWGSGGLSVLANVSIC